MALTFSPPTGPSFQSAVHLEPQFVEAKSHGGYDQQVPRLLRPLRRAELRWNAASDTTREYIESFIAAIHGTVGPFEWTPFDNIPSPSGMLPTLSEVSGGSLGSRTYYVVFTWYDTTYGETRESGRASLNVSANNFLKVEIPPIPLQVEGWRVYVSETSGAEKLEATITSGARSWTQSADLSGSADPPAANTLTPAGKWNIQGRLGKVRSGANRWNMTLTLLEQIV